MLLATLSAHQTPHIIMQPDIVAHYTQTGDYTYVVYLKNNTLYELPLLLPNQGVFFKQIINNINASVSYSYTSDINGRITGNYSMDAEIKTDLWTKNYPLIDRVPFSSNGSTATFTQVFPINYSFYDNVVTQINTETGIPASNPKLIFHTTVILTQETAEGTIHAQLTPDLSMTLTQKILEIPNNLSSKQTGTLTHQIIIKNESIILQRNLFLGITVLFGLILSGLLFLTKNTPESITSTDIIINKIYKRNGEWIHKTVTPPPTALQHTLRFASIEDLVKIGEDLNKPIFHYTIPNSQKHVFYILDGTTTYLYELNPEENHNQSTPLTK